MKLSDLKIHIEETISKEIKKFILTEGEGSKTAYCIMCEGEYIEICHTKEEADKKCEDYNKNNPNKKFVVEIETYESEEELINKMDELGEELETENMKKDQSMEEKLHGKQHKLDVDNNGEIDSSDLSSLRSNKELEENIDDIQCEKCHKEICECGEMSEVNENIKERKILRLNEEQFIDMITKIFNESVPGLKAVEDSHKVNDKETKEHMANVDKKLKDALSIGGNDNPEFPKPIGKGGPDTLDPKKAVNNTEEEDEEMSMDRGENPLDLDYDLEPSESFKERVKKALEGDSTMGNAQGGNTIPTDTGKNLSATAEKRKKHKENAPMYVKDVQPVKVVKETTEEKKSVLEEEIQKMKKLTSYNEKTQ